ncbi:hypothetical protein SAMN04488543_0861 [Friedmanniella luteola]|uniref:Uncharacterized protein n=1 Tax=Friedmanniella luteola TaxID=546871 RepID=A0A1H1NGV4_9ACTN|nr:hypothetical protein [Friedmanniella luteola]SDR98163.1 hypothetical protein SAMN04488543_0861 [Friedmanniella luteola]
MATRPTALGLGCLVVAVVLVAAAAVAGFTALRDRGATPPVPGQQRCVATAGDRSVALDLEQARLTAIIVGLSVRRGLAPRAASIAMATVYQETGIRNLDGGDRDSVGLFQQRPSQGWGSPEELQDPYYATGKFYDALVKVDGWQSGDINDVAQAVQRSGYPEAYRDHEADARVLASALTGQSAAAFSCLDRQEADGDAAALADSLTQTFGEVRPAREGRVVTVQARSDALAWAYAGHAVANAASSGVVEVQTLGRVWRASGQDLPRWAEAATPAPRPRTVTITVR